jgi:hypothetical protein
MRTMLKVQIPVQTGSKSIQDGSLAETVKSVFSRIEPEAAYFCAEGGKRTLYAFFDLADPTEICPTNEPFFINLDAEVELVPCMTQEELEAGMAKTLG